jgi:hypothetical protein
MRSKLAMLFARWAVRLDPQTRIYDPGYNDIGKQRVEDGVTLTLAKIPMAAWIPTKDVDVALGVLAAKLEEKFGPMDWDAADMRDMAEEQRETVKKALVK